MKYFHILSNVSYGGGEEVLTNLVRTKPGSHFLLLLRYTTKISSNSAILNASPLKSFDTYSLLQQSFTFIYLLFYLVLLRFNPILNSPIDNFVFHGFPCQFALPFARLLFPRRGIYFIYHQIKHFRSDIFSFPYRIFLYFEYLSLLLSSPLSIGAPSKRALESVEKTVLSFYNFNLSNRHFKLFEFKNSFSPFPVPTSENDDLIFSMVSSFGKFILIVGRFQSVKGQLRLIHFIHKNINLRDINFVFAGDGPTLYECRLYCKSANLSNIFFLGAVPRSTLAYYYSSCICTFLPSYEESFGVSIYESGYFKKTVLVFSLSLLVAPFVKLVDINSTSLSDLVISQLSEFPEDILPLLFTAQDTHESLERNLI